MIFNGQERKKMEWLRAAAYIALVITTFTATFLVAKI
jgi:type IV secretory pathway VirB2 component (pilin)